MATNPLKTVGSLLARVLPKHPDAKKRNDGGFVNEWLGYGTSRDKLSLGMFASGSQLTDQELHSLYYFDDVAAKIVNTKPAEMFRRGYKLVSKKNPKAAEALQARGRELELDSKYLRGKQWGALWGGSLLVLGALDDAENLALPLNEKAIRDVRYLNVVDRRYATVLQWQENALQAGYGMPAVYSVGSPSGKVSNVHASRVLRFDGVPETDPVTRRQLAGWTFSALQRPYDVVRDFAMSWKSVAHLISDASQGVWKIEGLLDLISNDREGLITRMAFADMTRSAGRAVMVDAGGSEDFTRVATSFAGLDAVLDRLMMRMSSAADMPVTKLMGRSAAGMNATGEGDARDWYDTIATGQTNEVKPDLLRVYRIIGAGQVPDDLDVEFCPLWQPTEQEKATTYKTNADADKVYFDMGLPGEAILIGRFGSGNGKIEVDEEALRSSLDREIELLKNPPEDPTPDPTDPNDPNATQKPDPNAEGAVDGSADEAKPVEE